MNKKIAVISGLLLVILALWLLVTPSRFVHNLIERLDNISYDLQLRTKVLTQNAQPNSSIAIVDIDDHSLKIEGRWPWSRAKVAELVNILERQGAQVIAFDIFFSEPEINLAQGVISKLTQKKLNFS